MARRTTNAESIRWRIFVASVAATANAPASWPARAFRAVSAAAWKVVRSALIADASSWSASALLLLQLDFPAAALARKFLDQARLCVRRLAVTLLGLCVDGADGERHRQAIRIHVDGGGAAFLRRQQLRFPEQREAEQDRLLLARIDGRQYRLDLHRHVRVRIRRMQEALRLGH